VVIPLLMTHFVMLQRNLVYTGITRAKKICIIVGTTKALAYTIHNMVVLKRNTRLKERLTSKDVKLLMAKTMKTDAHRFLICHSL
jgi:ATP-dependent exoDNAse (exonuclease V) alpha subunit